MATFGQPIPGARAWLETQWRERPLPLLVFLAAAARLIAVIGSPGFAFFDDHFLVIETAYYWAQGLPYSLDPVRPFMDSFVYAGFHTILWRLFALVGLTDPLQQMFIVRVLHAAWSLLAVVWGYRLALRLSGDLVTARTAGLLLALFWFMPFLSVRTADEWVGAPLLLLGVLLSTKADDTGDRRRYALVGFIYELACELRYLNVFFPIAAGLWLLWRRQWGALLWLCVGFGVPFLVSKIFIDNWVYGEPFFAIITYFKYNVQQLGGTQYPTGPVYNYLLLLLGILLPPVSLMLLFGVARSVRLYPAAALGSVLFFVAHSLITNKQERFILPIVPLVIVLGVVGWRQYLTPERRRRFAPFLKYAAVWFWSLNLLGMAAVSVVFMKKTQIQAAYYFHQHPEVQALVLDVECGEYALLPMAYAAGAHPYIFETQYQQPCGERHTPDSAALRAALLRPALRVGPFIALNAGSDFDYLRRERPDLAEGRPRTLFTRYLAERFPLAAPPQVLKPEYLVMIGEKDFASREALMQTIFPKMKLVNVIHPTWLEALLHRLNPNNPLFTCRIYMLDQSYRQTP